MKIQTGDMMPEINLPAITGGDFDLSALKGKKIMLTFYRFAQCPFCNLRIHELTKTYDKFGKNFEMVAIFQAPISHLSKTMKRHNAPFTILADTKFNYFIEHSVERSWFKFLKACAMRFPRVAKATSMGFLLTELPHGYMSTIPVDVLIDESGKVQRVLYGKDTGDHIPIKEIIEFSNS
ncbi:MAG: redoxin domain-containing protein [Dehalococcoidia bacterium]